MPIFNRLFEIIASFGGFMFGLPEYALIKFALIFLGLLFSFGLIGYWIYLESKYKWGRWLWGVFFNMWAEARIKPEFFQKEWKKLQNVFAKDKMASLFQAEEIMQNLLNLYFFEKEPLKTRLEKTSKITIPNIERLKMASGAIEIIKARQNRGEKIEISESEILSILKEFEQALLGMLVITEEDLWATKTTRPQL